MSLFYSDLEAARVGRQTSTTGIRHHQCVYHFGGTKSNALLCNMSRLYLIWFIGVLVPVDSCRKRPRALLAHLVWTKQI